MVHIGPPNQYAHAAVEVKVANLCVDNLFQLHGLPEMIISDPYKAVRKCFMEDFVQNFKILACVIDSFLSTDLWTV